MGGASHPAELSALLAAYPLPHGWALPECFIDRAAIGGAVIELAGLVSVASRGTDVTGSAAELSRVPLERAYYELVERASVVDALDRKLERHALFDADRAELGVIAHSELFPDSPAESSWRYARSNGVALGATWHDASRAALAELVERDRILRSWYGETQPECVTQPASDALSALEAEYACERYFFPESRVAPSRSPLDVAAVFAFPKISGAPLAIGMGAATTRALALAKAERECLQGIGFLWGEAIPEAKPEVSATSGYHQELYLLPEMHEALRCWLRGAHQRTGVGHDLSPSSSEKPRFADLTPENLTGRLFVAKAVADSELPLIFGCGHPWLSPAVSEAFGAHPIA